MNKARSSEVAWYYAGLDAYGYKKPVKCVVLFSRFEVGVNRSKDTEHVVIPVHLREKYKQSGYNHTSTPLFGLPFLITIPRTLSEEKFYNLLLLRLWYGFLLFYEFDRSTR